MAAAPDATPGRSEGEAAETWYELTLFVSGATVVSARAIANARQLCDIHLNGHYRLSVVDVHDDPVAVRGSGPVATPTLVRDRPVPVRKFVGDLSNFDKVLLALDLPGVTDATATPN